MKVSKILSTLLLTTIIFTGSVEAKYVQVADQESMVYPYEPLNFDMYFPQDNMTVGEILSLIEVSSNLRVFDHIEIPSDKIIPDSSTYKTVGGMLHRILKEYNAIPYVDKYVIHLDFYETAYMTLPYGWDIENTIKKIKKYFPDVEFFIEGFKIKAFGDKLKIKEVQEKFVYLNKVANQKLKLKLKIFDYKNEKIEQKAIYVANRTHKLELVEPIKIIDVEIGHNEDVNVVLNDNVYTLNFDLQEQEITLKNINFDAKMDKENKTTLPLKFFERAGLVVPTNNNFDYSALKTNNSFMFTFSVSEGFFNN